MVFHQKNRDGRLRLDSNHYVRETSALGLWVTAVRAEAVFEGIQIKRVIHRLAL